jgi:hypothetical protein
MIEAFDLMFFFKEKHLPTTLVVNVHVHHNDIANYKRGAIAPYAPK